MSADIHDLANKALAAALDEIERLRADRDAYRARIDKVRALCDDAYWLGGVEAVILEELRAALDGDAE